MRSYEQPQEERDLDLGKGVRGSLLSQMELEGKIAAPVPAPGYPTKTPFPPTPSGNPNLTQSLLFTVGVNLFYLCIIIYLYGDLAIYAAAVPVSLMQVTWYVSPKPPAAPRGCSPPRSRAREIWGGLHYTHNCRRWTSGLSRSEG